MPSIELTLYHFSEIDLFISNMAKIVAAATRTDRFFRCIFFDGIFIATKITLAFIKYEGNSISIYGIRYSFIHA